MTRIAKFGHSGDPNIRLPNDRIFGYSPNLAIRFFFVSFRSSGKLASFAQNRIQ
jgi:hypothetical protein